MNYSEICRRPEEARPHHLQSYIYVIFNDSFIQSVICKTINYRTSRLRIHYSYSYIETSPLQWRVTKNLAYTCMLDTHSFWAWFQGTLSCATSAVKQSRFLWSRPKHPYIIVTLNNKPLGTEHLSNPDSNGHMGREHRCIFYD